MSSKNHEINGYSHSLDLPVILHLIVRFISDEDKSGVMNVIRKAIL
jgi:hypothetical protein